MKVIFIGSGNVATQMALAFNAAGSDVLQVWSRSLKNAEILAGKVGAEPIADLKDLHSGADVYIVSVKDDEIAHLIAGLEIGDALIVHTSGATNMDVFEGRFNNYGVLYPLQTFSKARAIDFFEVPLCIEANNLLSETALQFIAEKISNKIYKVNSADRQTLHLAAVFACNFTNHLYTLSKQLLDKKNLDFDLLRPLIKETADKIRLAEPIYLQTGPAIRSDEQTMARHLQLLKNDPALSNIYQVLSNSIKKNHS